MTRINNSPSAAHSPEVPAAVGVVGGGRMGGGIAHAFLMAGARVSVVDVSPEAAEAARGRIARSVDASLARGASGEREEILGRLRCGAEYEALEGCELVVEAVPEDPELKAETFRRIAQTAPGAALATNTSSLSVTELAGALEHPEKVIGLHFFNPVPASTLVEIIVAERTPPELLERARGWVAGLGKTPVVVKDSPGFASSRLGVAIALEAMRMVEEGVASPEDIDAAMVLGYKFPVGPLALTDIVGLDVRLGIARYLHSTLGERFAPPQILVDKVARGEVGRKAGAGFYRYEEE
ncbi:3-hydroxyacyl-CoA dehydrogenase family protein [Corynebacterium uropygiale]|uniref:3-hydroxyacyl-CoA dehydrogenase family protein n=1 Tax=Corynebacterium uropygiale TaxID=1775911 RepID=A0A9X1U1J9_9CORY|nr:3-hydroxyacyl-CoA dehydrogenase family protein [Corynebacterium uropygiale]MCF4007668.1 3-hydroxyacyl-CoA dehydrogenase family protein [Corynebacterium uropygiale]